MKFGYFIPKSVVELELLWIYNLVFFSFKISSGAIFGTDQNIVVEEVAKKKEKMYNNACIKKITEKCQTHKVWCS
jgi:hypothetical protein